MHVEFNEKTSSQKEYLKKPPKMVQAVMNLGLVQTEQQADRVLLAVAVFFILVTILVVLLNADSTEGIVLDSNIDPETGLPFGVPQPQ